MIYLFVLFFCTLYFFSVEGYRGGGIVFLPAFIIYVMVSALQYNVGTDYFSYIEIYGSLDLLERYFDIGEYSFYYINTFLNYIGAPPQSLFFVFSLLQSFFIFEYFIKVKNKGFTLWVLFFIFFTVTNIYNNQLNLLRQYAALTLVPILTLYLFERKYAKFTFGCLLATTFHSSGIVFFVFLAFRFLFFYTKNKTFVIFILTLPLYVYLTNYISLFMGLFGLDYSYYIGAGNSDAFELISLVTKLYYLPAILFFYFIYYNRVDFNFNLNGNAYYSFMIVIFSCTYWSFMMSLEVGILSRVSSYFWFFIVFPLYYVAIYLKGRSNLRFCFYMMYLLLPYVAKVTILAKNEFIYNSYIFN